MTTSNKQFAVVADEFRERGVGVAMIHQVSYDQLVTNPRVGYYRLDVVYDGSLDEDTDFLVTPPDGEVLDRLAELVAEEVRLDYRIDPSTSLGWSVEIYETDAHGHSGMGSSPLVAHRG